MVKVVIADPKPKGKSSKRAGISVIERRVRDSRGQLKMLRKLDLGSSTFGEDLQYVFRKNVAKARRENKWITGSSDVAPPKS